MAEDHKARLVEQVERLERLYEAKREQLRGDFPAFEPEEIVDPNGRPILMDALIAIVDARKALV